jgi:hypothetical protein
MVAPPTTWLITSRTVHSVHGVAFPSWLGSTPSTTIPARSSTFTIVGSRSVATSQLLARVF